MPPPEMMKAFATENSLVKVGNASRKNGAFHTPMPYPAQNRNADARKRNCTNLPGALDESLRRNPAVMAGMATPKVMVMPVAITMMRRKEERGERREERGESKEERARRWWLNKRVLKHTYCPARS